MSIETGDARLVRQLPWRVPFAVRIEIAQQQSDPAIKQSLGESHCPRSEKIWHNAVLHLL